MLVSSHLLHEVQLVADHLLVVARGRILADAPIVELMQGHDSLEDAYIELTDGDVDGGNCEQNT